MIGTMYNAVQYAMVYLRSKGVSFPELKMKQGAKGQGLVEYALILALVAVVVIVVLSVLGPQINYIFVKIDCKFKPDLVVLDAETGKQITCQQIWGETP